MIDQSEAKRFLDEVDAHEFSQRSPDDRTWIASNKQHVIAVILERARIQAYIDKHLCQLTGRVGIYRSNPVQRFLARLLFRPEWDRIAEMKRELDELNAAFRARLDAKSTPEQREARLRAGLGLPATKAKVQAERAQKDSQKDFRP